jgi:pyruvate/2-oxoglutarate dehydrogenase complex dihydrolipoamide acyltransferase (E2) component
MNPQARFVKTEKGQEEIRNRTYRLPPRLRSLLVLVDGAKPVAELVQAAAGFGGGPGFLEALIKEGFIEEALNGKHAAAMRPAPQPAAAPAPRPAPTAATPVAAPGPRPAPAAAPADEADRVYAAKAAMRRYIKVAAGMLEARTLNKLVDDVRTLADVARCLGELRPRFESNGYDEAFATMDAEIAGIVKG